jgi:hypothetical protein
MKICSVALKRLAVMTGIALSGVGFTGAITPANALTFNFSAASGMSQQAIDGFAEAGGLWSSIFSDNVTVKIDINFIALGTNILGQAGSTQQTFSYTQVRNALNADKSSTEDNTAVTNLSSNPAFNMLLNRTYNNPNGIGSATTYLDNDGDANNTTIRMTNANAKALGLATTGTSDASISFSNLFTWDFDRSNGITAGTFDFVGVAAHEIGHALGFISGVDILDINSPNVVDNVNYYYNDNQFTFVNTLDLFRYSTASTAQGAIDWTADTRDKYFSLDGGSTKIVSFSTGVNYGDGSQASHWKDNLGIGIMDPTFGKGELGIISENDKLALDVIGWNRASATAVPEPENFIGTFIFTAFGVKMVLKRRQKLLKSTEIAAIKED